jgi:putative transposase
LGFLATELGLRERRACRVVGLERAVQQYLPVPKDDGTVIACVKDFASKCRRYGYLRLHAMVRRKCLVLNHKRTYRLYTELRLQVRTKKRRRMPRGDRVAAEVPKRPIPGWSLAFVSDQLADHRRFRLLILIDDLIRFCAAQIVDVSIPQHVWRGSSTT